MVTVTIIVRRINKNHVVYQRLASLIQVRNAIAHAKPKLEEIEATEEDLVTSSVMWSGRIPRAFIGGIDFTLDGSKQYSPIEYHDALEKLEKWFLGRFPDRLKKIALVIERSKESQKKSKQVTYTKYLDR